MDFITKIRKLGIPVSSEKIDSFRVPAIHRGSNDFNIIVSKVDGRAYDFVRTKSWGFKELVKVLTGQELDEEIERQEIIHVECPETTFNENSLQLFPQYKYWNERGISDDVLRITKGGLCHGGPFYRYFVFPIYNRAMRICGYSGRDTTGKRSKKWLHDGKSSKFIYGPYLNSIVTEAIEREGKIFLVESIGDCLSLWQCGVWNVTPTFGLNISNDLMTYLLAKSCKVVISFNSDHNYSGNFGAVKAFSKLIENFSLDKVGVRLSMYGLDFNDMLKNNSITGWMDEEDSPLKLFQQKRVFSKNFNDIKMTKSEIKTYELLARA